MELGANISCIRNLRQGDVIGFNSLPGVLDGELRWNPTSAGAVIISQTCDIVQISESKKNLLVAPIVPAPDNSLLSNARRGRSPLKLFLEGCGPEGEDAVADLQYAVSVPKESVEGLTLLGRRSTSDHSQAARDLSMAIGRAFSRFAFPDAVQSSLSKFLRKARDKAGTKGPLGRVLEWVDSLRVSSDQWDKPGRILTIYVIVSAKLLIFPDDVDPNWTWRSASATLGVDPKFTERDLNTVSGVLADYCGHAIETSPSTDYTTLLRLWELWVIKLQKELLEPSTDSEVAEYRVELLSDEDFSYAQWQRTESLDLEDLSHSSLPIESE